MGEYAKAESLLQQAVVIRKKSLGEQHPAFAQSLNNLALLYNTVGKYAKAEPLLKRALAIRKDVLGEQHPAYANSLHNLAGLYGDMGEDDRAVELAEKATKLEDSFAGTFFAVASEAQCFNYASKDLGRQISCFRSGDLRAGRSMASTPRCGGGGASWNGPFPGGRRPCDLARPLAVTPDSSSISPVDTRWPRYFWHRRTALPQS